MVRQAPLARRMIPAEEVELLIADALRRGEQTAVARAESAAAAALGQVAASVAEALPALAAVAHSHLAGAADLAMCAARKIAGEALDRFPEGPAAAALKSLAREIEAAPRLAVQAPAELVERLQAALEKTAGDVGYPGQISVVAQDGAPRPVSSSTGATAAPPSIRTAPPPG